MFRGPSWDDPYRVPLCSPRSTRNRRNRVARQEDISSGASSRLAPLPLPKELWQCLPAEIGPLVPAASSFRFRLSDEAGTAVPITKSPCTLDPSRGSKIFGKKPVDNGDIGCNSWNFPGTLVRRRDSLLGPRPTRLPFRSPPLTSNECPNPMSLPPTHGTCRA